MDRKLYKSSHNKMIKGVCAGIAEYFGFDVTETRIVFVIFFAFTFWLYLALLLLMPEHYRIK